MHDGYWARWDRERRARDPEYAAVRRARSRAWKDRNRAYNRLRDRIYGAAKRNPPSPTSPFHLRGGGDA